MAHRGERRRRQIDVVQERDVVGRTNFARCRYEIGQKPADRAEQPDFGHMNQNQREHQTRQALARAQLATRRPGQPGTETSEGFVMQPHGQHDGDAGAGATL
jgi:hypothetical protein